MNAIAIGAGVHQIRYGLLDVGQNGDHLWVGGSGIAFNQPVDVG